MRPEIKNIKQNLQANNLKGASEAILKAHEQIKNYPVLIAFEGVYYAQSGDFERAIAAFAVALQRLPRDPVLYYNLASVLRATGRLVAAEEAIRKSLHFIPLNPLALYELAQIQTYQGKHNEAILTLFKCIQNSALFFPAYVAITQYFLLDNHPELAIKLYETAIKGAPREQFFKDRLKELKEPKGL